ncbi:hypothetical protein Tco_0724178 [Tanacetum coccineum]
MNMILQSSIKDKILAAQKEAVDEFAGLQKGLDKMIEQRSDGMYWWPRMKNDIAKWKRISDKRTKNQAKTDKTEHGMEKHEKPKVNQSQSQSQPRQSQRVKIDGIGLQERSRALINFGYSTHTKNTPAVGKYKSEVNHQWRPVTTYLQSTSAPPKTSLLTNARETMRQPHTYAFCNTLIDHLLSLHDSHRMAKTYMVSQKSKIGENEAIKEDAKESLKQQFPRRLLSDLEKES